MLTLRETLAKLIGGCLRTSNSRALKAETIPSNLLTCETLPFAKGTMAQYQHHMASLELPNSAGSLELSDSSYSAYFIST
jgi:hypothetical protein